MKVGRLAVALILAVLAVLALRDCTRMGPALPWRQMYDFADFYCAGQALDVHRDPYDYEPLHACEHRVNTSAIFRNDPSLAIPAPQPPFDFPPFMALARLNFANAETLDAIAIVVATLLAIVALAQTGVPLDVAAIALLLPAGYVELNAGQIVPFALLALMLCGAALVKRRDTLAGFCAGLVAIEPHLALPVALAVLLFVPRARTALLLTLGCLGVVGAVVAGPALAVEYVLHVIPQQASAEIGFPYQYSLTYALDAVGVSQTVAQALGDASFVAVVAFGLWLARRLAQTLQRRELIVFLPAATAVTAGAYVHVVELCFAVPAAVVMAVALRGWQRNASAAALCALMVPWIAVWSIKKLFALSLLACAVLLVRLQIEPLFAAGTVAAIAAAAYAFELRPPSLFDAFRTAYSFPGNAVVQREWAAFVRSLQPADSSWLAIKVPVWGALVTLLATAVTRLSARPENPRPSG